MVPVDSHRGRRWNFSARVDVDGCRWPGQWIAPGIVTNEEFTRELAAALNRPVFFPVPDLRSEF